MEESFKRAILRAGVRYEVLEAAFESDDFEELMSSLKRELTGVIARLDLADQIDSKRMQHEYRYLFRHQQRGLPRR